MKDVSLKLHNNLKDIINERRDAKAKTSRLLSVNFVDILLSLKDEDVEITNDIITSTLLVWHFRYS